MSEYRGLNKLKCFSDLNHDRGCMATGSPSMKGIRKWAAMRKEPYTELGISRVPCQRCGEPSHHQWQICATGNLWCGVCVECDIALNKMVIEFMGLPKKVGRVYAATQRVLYNPKSSKPAKMKKGLSMAQRNRKWNIMTSGIASCAVHTAPPCTVYGTKPRVARWWASVTANNVRREYSKKRDAERKIKITLIARFFGNPA